MNCTSYIASIWISEGLGGDAEKRWISYPGITPEWVIPLRGYLTYEYLGQRYHTDRSVLFAFLHGNVYTDLARLERFAIVTFRSRGLAGLAPFTGVDPAELIRRPVVPAHRVWGPDVDRYRKQWSGLPAEHLTAAILEFLERSYRNTTGFITEVAEAVGPAFSLDALRRSTNYSYSTIERKFKAEAGITPKKYLTLKRFKNVVAELVDSGNTDWMDYVVRFGYHDQSHLIKEVRKYAGFSPSQIAAQDNFLQIRPDLSFLTKFYNERP